MKEVLENLGLTKNEATIYLTLLKLGPSQATKLIKHTKLHRAGVYDTLKKLIAKGLVGKITSNKNSVFEPANPIYLKSILKQKEERLNEIMPDLVKLFPAQSASTIRVFKDKEGIRATMNEILLHNPKEVLTIGEGNNVYDIMPIHVERFHKERIKRKIKVRELYLNSAKLRAKQVASLGLSETRILPKHFTKQAHIDIYNNIVMICAQNPKGTVVTFIDNISLAETFKEYFEFLWEQSEQITSGKNS